MNQTRQTSLQDRLSAMIRSLTVGAAAALAFYCVFFSPLIDQKESIAAAAQSKSDRGGGDRGENDQSNRGDRDGSDNRSERSRDKGSGDRGENDQGDRGGRDGSGNRKERSRDRDSGEHGNSDNLSSESNQSEEDPPDRAESSAETRKENETLSIHTPKSSNSGNKLIPSRPRFRGDSEPQSEPLSAGEEREAIDNGWK
ncbi:MAG: hypothetical protein ABJY83_19675 [Roseibium sp.]